jgi:4,5-DOPA dioxygenase extradiol
MPAVFVGHGSPMNVVEDNPFTRGFKELGQAMAEPKAILAISAHWFVNGTYLTGDPHPRTIHDFSGFPRALYEIEYRAPGSVALANRVRALVGEDRASLRTDWGLDHGTWSVLHHMFPRASIPVVQLSIDRSLHARQHYDIGRSLGELRDEGILIMGSGNVVHNLRDAIGRMRTGNMDTPPWARRFDAAVEQALVQRDTGALLSLLESEDGRMAHPSPDHYWPLLYAYGSGSGQAAAVRFSSEDFDLGSVAMRNVVFD